MHRRCLLALLGLTLTLTSTSSAAWDPVAGQTRWDNQWERIAARHFPQLPQGWKRLRQQCFAESSFNPKAVSPVGAEGLCQFMPRTWKMMQRIVPQLVGRNAFQPPYAILAQGFYMQRLWDGWTAPRSDENRWKWTLGSYNAGMGRLLDAQRRCTGSCDEYDSIEELLPQETRDYVARITEPFAALDTKPKPLTLEERVEALEERINRWLKSKPSPP